MALRHWSQTASGNAAPTGINWAEGMPPSAVNNSSREEMAQVRQVYTPDHWQWVDVSATASVASQTTFKVATDLTSAFTVNRRARLRSGSTTRYMTIVSSSFGTETTVTVTVDSGSLSASHSIAAVAALTDDGVPRNSFARLASTNTFTAANLFQATTSFSAVAVFQGGMSVSGAAVFRNAVATPPFTLTFSAATFAPDLSLGTDFIASLSGSAIFSAPSNVTVGQRGKIILDQNATGGFSVSFAAAYVFEGGDAPIIDLAANGRTVLDYIATGAAELMVKIAWKEGTDTIGYFREYDKGTVSAAASLSQAHGLGRYPSHVTAFYENVSANLSYAIGDRVDVNSVADGPNENAKPSLYYNTTSVVVRQGTGTPRLVSGTGSVAAISDLAWKMIFRVYE